MWCAAQGIRTPVRLRRSAPASRCRWACIVLTVAAAPRQAHRQQTGGRTPFIIPCRPARRTRGVSIASLDAQGAPQYQRSGSRSPRCGLTKHGQLRLGIVERGARQHDVDAQWQASLLDQVRRVHVPRMGIGARDRGG